VARSQGAGSPFGQATRMRVLEAYFARAGEVTAENAWEHVYRCLLWMNQGAGLAHIYDSNHMQPGGNFHSRAITFTDELCRLFGVTRAQLPAEIDHLFKGCVEEWKRRRSTDIDTELESELVAVIEQVLRGEGVADSRVRPVARHLEVLSRDFFTIGNKRKNALGEGFEDLLYLLLVRVARVPPEKIALRRPVSELPGFRRAPARLPGSRPAREPHPDIATLEGGITHVITSAKWSMRQDRETQFQSEYTAYQMNKTQSTELRFALITNEFDVARLNNVARAIPGGAGGYIFHNIYHISPELLLHTQGDRIGTVRHWIGAGKILALSDFLADMRGRYGAS
jgi:hypothetical protein